MGIPVATSAKPQETLLLLEGQCHDNIPEVSYGWMMGREAAFILSCRLEA